MGRRKRTAGTGCYADIMSYLTSPLCLGRHPLGSPTYSTFQSLEELDSPLPTILTSAHTSLTSAPSSLTTKQTGM